MVSFWKNFHTSREQVLADIESVLEAILKVCTANLDSLTQEERSSFMDEYSSLADARVQLNKGTSNSKLTGALNECEKLKLNIERACRKHEQDKIRRGLESPAAIATPESRQSSIALVDPDPSYRTPPSESSTPVQSNLALTSGNSSYPSPSNPSTGTSSSAVSSGTPVAHEATSSTSAVPTDGSLHAPPTDTECMMFGPDSSVGSPTFNIDSEEATGATHTSPGNSPSLGLSAQRPPTGAHQPQTAHTVRRERVMLFTSGTVASPTFNIRSPRASGTIEQIVSQRSETVTESFR
ncbi:hypothetical protein DFJ58DRAFT_802768 [Suillus subalutaceus]|uniref:uncharacterized protein n=1 Tax=Suillus subalutaceus TaxID=48586 RepID=UPI001B85CAAB|nr:uncharacterized protein DFJ58DRAFT_802768 [Suillus subalutaceus]KAG1844316.1 hypothetical protein DFJ58DRAFT_802768 [Suillus subalutaceus]